MAFLRITILNIVTSMIDFLTGSPLPEPTSISTLANNMLTVHQGSLE